MKLATTRREVCVYTRTGGTHGTDANCDSITLLPLLRLVTGQRTATSQITL